MTEKRQWGKKRKPDLLRARFHAQGEELRVFGDALRDCLGLAPIYTTERLDLLSKEEREMRQFFVPYTDTRPERKQRTVST